MVDFLLEIGCEEIPAHDLERAAHRLEELFLAFLKDNRIFCRSSRLFYTPRRLGIIILGIARHQREEVTEIQGPARKFAFDEKEQPTEALLGFMRAQKLTPKDILVRKTTRGEYVFGKKTKPGEDTKSFLKDFIPVLIASLPFSKTMIWDETKVRFARPIRWLICLFDTRIIPVTIGKIEAGKKTYIFDRGEKIAVKLDKPRDHLLRLRKEGVITEPAERKKVILQKINRAEKRFHGKVLVDEELLNEVTNLVEYPEVAVGEFSREYLELPADVLITVLKAHLRLFSFDKTNQFLVVFNGTKRMAHAVKTGFEKVVKARLQDAIFYYDQDTKYGLKKMVNDLRGVTWLEGLGTLYDKTQRLVALASFMAERTATGDKNIKIDRDTLTHAAQYCKADLVSQVVREKELTKLQGIMGKHYALKAGENSQVANAIYEHYLPRFAGDGLPGSIEGSILGIVDRLDSITGAFILDKVPTGSEDPYGLRRQGYSIVQLSLENDLHFSLADLINEDLKLYNKDTRLAKKIMEFIYDRLARYLEEKTIAYDEAKAIIVTVPHDINDCLKRCQALKTFRERDDFKALVIGQKRVANILKNVQFNKTINEELLREKAEQVLYEKGKKVELALASFLNDKNYKTAFEQLLSLRKEIDQLFDDVLIMAEDKTLKENRLALVNYIHDQFLRVADLSQIVIEGEADIKQETRKSEDQKIR